MTSRRTPGPGGEPPPGPFPVSDPNRAAGLAGGAGAEVAASGADVPAVPLPAELAGAARTLFGDRLAVAAAYAELLAGPGVARGLIGPRETSRLWDRHLLNCAPVTELIPVGSTVLDVGSGAGLPGIVLAIARPDLSVTLVEPLARRAAFLAEVVTALDLADAVTVLRARAEELAPSRRRGHPGSGRRTAMVGRSGDRSPDESALPAGLPVPADIVTARAVAPLDRLAGWCLPLTAPGGRVLALKGVTATDEVAQHAAAVRRLGGARPVVRECGVGIVVPPTTVVDIVRERVVGPLRESSAGPAGGRRGSTPTDRRSGPRR